MKEFRGLLFWSVLLCVAVPMTGSAPSAGSKKEPAPAFVERVGSTGFLQIEAGSFNALSPRQQELAYWLSEASIAIDPIIYDQLSRFGLRQRALLELVFGNPKGVDPVVLKKVSDYTKLFWASHGNHQESTARKFVPEFTVEEFEAAAVQAMHNRGPRQSGTVKNEADVRAEVAALRQSLFDPDFESQLTAKSPQGGLDVLQASANNFYARDVSLADLQNFKDHYPLNSRIAKKSDGTIVEQVYRAGSEDGTIPPGLYARYLGRAIGYLRKAREAAEPGQADVIDNLIRYYQTGEPQDWTRFGISWVGNNPPVDFANGFIEVYRDARATKGSSQSFVSVTDAHLNELMQKIAANAQYFEGRAPWADQYKKQGVKPPMAKAIETVIESGDFSVTTVGDNLPNENDVREKYGTKSFLFTGSTRVLNRSSGSAMVDEFSASDEQKAISRKYGTEASDLLTAMHEIIGHGSGKVNPNLVGEPIALLKEYGSTLEEARADLVALWNVTDPKLQELGLISSPDVGRAMYYAMAAAPLIQLRSIPTGDTIEEDHQRGRALQANYVMDKTGAIEMVERDGKHYMVVKDFDKMHQGVGMLLAELARIKGEGDYPAIKALIDKYGVHFDPAIRDEVVARYAKLNLPTYRRGINPELRARMSGSKVAKVRMTYPRDIVEQELWYASMYGGDMPGSDEPRSMEVEKGETAKPVAPAPEVTRHHRRMRKL